MTRKQLSALLAPIAVRYPLSFAVNAATVALWSEVIGDLEFEPCRDAIFKWLSETHDFPPGPGDIRQVAEAAAPSEREVEILEHRYVVTTTQTNPETKKREKKRREYVRTTPAERWAHRRHLDILGYCQVAVPHHEIVALVIMPKKNCIKTGVDTFGNEELPRYEMA